MVYLFASETLFLAYIQFYRSELHMVLASQKRDILEEFINKYTAGEVQQWWSNKSVLPGDPD